MQRLELLKSQFDLGNQYNFKEHFIRVILMHQFQLPVLKKTNKKNNSFCEV